MTVYPQFQPQNPAINGYSLGWASCTAYSAAMAASFDRQVKMATTGEAVRRATGDTSGGLTLKQVDAALNQITNVNLSVYYRLPWALFAKFIDSGMGGILQVWYAPIADSRFDAGRGFRENHAVFVPPNWAAMDPLADGRYGEAYKYRNEPYPRELLKRAAGKLDIRARRTDPYKPLGYGYVYAAMTRDNVHTYRVRYGGRFWVYTIGPDGRINGRTVRHFSDFSTSACTVPKSYAWPGHSNRTLVRVTNPKSSLNGRYIAVPQSNVSLQVVP